jgi:hypothetical protein
MELGTRHSQVSTRPGYAVVTSLTMDCSPYRTIVTFLKQASSWGVGSEIHITWREDTYLLTFAYVRHYRK